MHTLLRLRRVEVVTGISSASSMRGRRKEGRHAGCPIEMDNGIELVAQSSSGM